MVFPDSFGKISFEDENEYMIEDFKGQFEVDLTIKKLHSITGKIHFDASSWRIIGRPVF